MVFDRLDLNLTQDSGRLRMMLNQEGFRLTNQRQKILEIFKNKAGRHHLSAEDIYQELSFQGMNIGFSTIYRALHIMVQLGLLRELELAESRKYYELANPLMHQHHHLVCLQCGAVSEFEEHSITTVGNHEAAIRGFAWMNSQFIVSGVCPNCQRLCEESG